EFVLVAGVVLLVLVVFNAMTAGVDVDGCDGEEHSHACCGHDHGDADGHHDHDHGHSHEHVSDAKSGHDHGEDEACGHAHDSTFDGGLVAALILMVPLLVAAVRTPDGFSKSWFMKREALAMSATEVPEGMETLSVKKAEAQGASDSGAATSGGYGAFTLQDLESLVEKSEAGNYMLSIQEIFYTAGDTEIQNVLKGLPVETIGQVLPDTMNDPLGRKLKVFRLFVQCCAADARPLSVTADFPQKAPPFKEMGWYKVKGTMDFVKKKGLTAPVIRGLELEEVPEPEDRMLY
ncbi:MAG: hypothetical protein P8J87_10285, partial [Verrucomicrobiales bacterium]|nr:hypothetical protein [Verrucomicrobiales bacterium]